MAEFGPAQALVARLVERVSALDIDEAADLYRARVGRLLLEPQAERHALREARRAAVRAGRAEPYERARRAASVAWRRAVPAGQGPWLIIGSTIANAAGALVLEDLLDEKTFRTLFGPWQLAMGRLVPVGPGGPAPERVPIGAAAGGERRPDTR